MKRYTAEFRGGDNGEKPWEWCVVDEGIGPSGSAIKFNLTEHEAKNLTLDLNKKENE